MEELEFSAKTVEEALKKALASLGLTREQVEVTVLKEGRSGILGIGAEEAKIRVTPITPTPDTSVPPAPEEAVDVVAIAKNILETLLEKMGVSATVVVQPGPEGEAAAMPTLAFDIKGEDVGILIGRHGQTLSCLQYIVGLVLSHRTKARYPMVIDAEGYKQRHYESLRDLAQRTAERVKARRMPFTLRPMSAFERRIIHVTLADDPDVTTESTGEGEARRVVVLTRRQGRPEGERQPR
ncbi:MAG: protein jag [Chloroflexi bacterium]|nr:protein jag [Chloroflexota bacterium]